MAASKLQLNWSGVTWTPSGGSASPISRVDGMDWAMGGQLLSYKGDTDKYPTVIVNHNNEPRVTLRMSDPAFAMALVPGAIGTLSATAKDAKGAALGDIVYTLVNAVVETPDNPANHAQFATATVTFRAFSTDGTTCPLSFTRS